MAMLASSYKTCYARKAIFSHLPNVICVIKRDLSNPPQKFPQYSTIYKCSIIKPISIINRIKFQQTILTAICIPSLLGLQLIDIISSELTLGFSIIAGVTNMFLHTFGYLCCNSIGFMYLNDDKQKVIIAYTDFWGRRIDMYTTVSDIMPLSDAPVTIVSPFYQTLRFYSSRKPLKLHVRFGEVMDEEKFETVVGKYS